MTWADNTIRFLTVFWLQNASLLLYLSANAGGRQITIVCTDFRKIPNALLFGKRNSVLSKFYTDWWCVAFTYVLFLDRKIHNNATEIPSRSDKNYEEKPYFGP